MPQQSKTKILVADDDPDIRQLMETCLGLEGYDVRVAEDGYDAICQITCEWRTPHPFDAALLDAAMPLCDGFTVARVLKTLMAAAPRSPRIRIGFFTAHHEMVEESPLLERHGDPYWRKGDDVRQMVAEIRAWLRCEVEYAPDCDELRETAPEPGAAGGAG
jgi:DNA-binding response OmpR family regulator